MRTTNWRERIRGEGEVGDGNIIPPLRFHDLVQAKVVAVPLDGTGVSYVGHFRASDSETIRSVKHGEVLAETETDQKRRPSRDPTDRGQPCGSITISR